MAQDDIVAFEQIFLGDPGIAFWPRNSAGHPGVNVSSIWTKKVSPTECD